MAILKLIYVSALQIQAACCVKSDTFDTARLYLFILDCIPTPYLLCEIQAWAVLLPNTEYRVLTHLSGAVQEQLHAPRAKTKSGTE